MLAVTGYIVSLQVSQGGVPKLPIQEAVLSETGLQGDKQRDRRYHGGPERALCLFSLEEITKLQAEGHPIYPGSTGENVTISGIEWAALRPGICLELGDQALVQISAYATPCKNIKESFVNDEFVRISQKRHPGESRIYVRVLRTGTLRVGQTVRVVPAPVTQDGAHEELRY
jgi:MOSC domain-containing protein YiiM